MECKHTDSAVKEKVPGAAVSKESHADSLPGYERTCDLISLKKVKLTALEAKLFIYRMTLVKKNG